MSDLQIGLLVIGAIVVVAVIAYNKWQESRLERDASRAFGIQHEDVLARTDSTVAAEPVVVPPVRAESVVVPSGRTIEHTFGEAPAPAPARSVPAADGPPPLLSDAVDFIVTVDCARDATGDDVLRHAQALVAEGLVKPVHWEGFDTATARWAPLLPQHRYARVRAGLQTANRSGPITAEDISAFFAGMTEVGLALAGELDAPDSTESLARAAALDQFCAEVDVQVGLSVIAADANTFAGTKLRAIAEAGGLTIGRDGRFHRTDENGIELFSLANVEPMPFHPETMKTLATRGVTVLLDVPRAPAAGPTFRLYLEFARQLEQALGGILVDDTQKPIGQPALDQIGVQVEHIQRAMAVRGIPAGSPLALRLFA